MDSILPPARPTASALPAKLDAMSPVPPMAGDMSILPAPPKPQFTSPSVDQLRSFSDVSSTRKAIYDSVLAAASAMQPLSNEKHTLRLNGVRYIDPELYSNKQHKDAVLGGKTMGRRLKGTWELTDNITGQVIDARDQVLANVPYVTKYGTMVHNGSEYTLTAQQRLKPGIYTRIKSNGELEAHANVLPGKGISHRYMLNPETNVYKLKLGQGELPLMPLLKSMGATDAEIKEAWGDQIYAANYKENDSAVVQKLKAKLLKAKDLEGDETTTRQKLTDVFERMELDPFVTKRTLGTAFDRMNKDAILATTKKLLAVSRGEQEVDDRDHLAYQTFHGPEDLLRERVERDHSGMRRAAFYKASFQGSLKSMPTGVMTPQLEQALLGSGLGQNLEEINPAEILDKHTKITRLGEGGIPSMDAIPDEARSVQPSHMGFMDPVRTPESMRAGVDTHIARGARKGPDGKIYAQFRDLKTGETVWRSPQELADVAVAFPGALKGDDNRVPAMKSGKITYVPREEIDYELPAFEDAFSALGNLIPIKSAVKAQRMAMASRMLTQALPLKDGEAPFVRGALPGTKGTKDFEHEFGVHMGAVRAAQDGQITDISDGIVKLRYADGSKDEVELFQNHPFNRKTMLHQSTALKPGDMFKQGQTIVRSNFTDKDGAMALGLNARTAYMPWKGYNFEDANVISEGMAKRMSSEHMYQHELEVTDQHKMGKRNYISLFPQKYDKQLLDTMDDDGVIKVGQTVTYDQPLILGAQEKESPQNKIHKQGARAFGDVSVLWKHHDPGVVTDIVQSKNGPVVLVKSIVPTQVGDKMSGRYGDKGVIAAIVPDHQMPTDSQGRPFEVLLNPLGIVTRTNPAQKVELMLGKIAELTGKSIAVPDFEDIEDMTEWAEQQLKKYNLKGTENIMDVTRNQYVNNVATGNRFYMKLHHTAESKGQGRGSGAYSSEDAPAKGGESGSKRISMLDVNALLSHGATETIRDAGLIRGQKNEEYWTQFMQGHTPIEPKVPLIYEKFVNSLKAAGINVVSNGQETNVMAMTNSDVKQLTADRVVRSGETVRFDKNMEPIAGGLFDPKLTGGHNGRQWAKIELPEPTLNPVMEEPARRLLGLTQQQLRDTIGGEHILGRYGTGPQAIAKALAELNVKREIDVARAQVNGSNKAARDNAIRRLGYLKGAEKYGLHPKDWILDAVPVLPPIFRPVTVMGSSGIPLVADPNYLYKELLDATANFKSMKDMVGLNDTGSERLAIYDSFKAITGLGDPIHPKLQEKNVSGILKSIFGSSPKFGTVQRKLLSSTVDNVGRAVITPNPDYDMDTVGIPEGKAFEVYNKFLIRRLKRLGMPMGEALRHVKDKTALAKDALLKEMETRPVFINRAPVLHRFGIMAFKPRLVSGDVMQISPLIVKGFNADFDGDAMQFHVPTSEAAVREAYDRMMPSKNLFHPADFKSVVHGPVNEYIGGLYHASSQTSARRPRVFASRQDAVAAYKRGDIQADDPVEIIQ
jgi:DNA-directed RNA polymerase subunit beta